ncbi:MAG: hypothetical protein DME57_05105 [Verrucomicrobia bacterium]|nr:MAG: hypothetical protein DME57_05105 [Verrucomicrobiota bacterium]
MKTTILTFALSIFVAVAVRADLKWEQSTVDVHPGMNDKQAVAHFKYENVGKAPVRFKSVKASCGCTTTQTQKEIVNPGEKGEIIASLNIGDRTGQQVKTVTVQTDEPPPAQSTTVLTLRATIPQPLEIKPAFVYWTTGDEPKTKKISVKAAKDFPAKKITIKSNSQNFESKVEAGKEGEWTIDVTPKDTSHPMGTALLVQTDFPKESPKQYYVNAQITAPQPPAMLRAPAQGAPPPTKASTPPAIPTATTGVQR